MPDGTPVADLTIAGGGLTVGVIGFGAVLREMQFDDGAGPRPMTLGLKSLDDYLHHSPHMGAVAGRYANRIGRGRFPLDGREIQLALNPGSRNHLHGGVTGFGKSVWTPVETEREACTLEIVRPDGDEGYPGRIRATCRYSIAGDGVLRIELTATTDAPTIVNLATHSYFNLDQSPDILDHHLQIPADFYTPVDDELIPTGAIAPVEGTPFDFRRERPVRLDVAGTRFAYDHNFVVARTAAAAPRLMARLTGPRTGTRLEIHSTEPGVQFYDGAKVNVTPAGLGDRKFGNNAGLCLEPQRFPDTPNNPDFGSAVLRPGETYRQVTEYRFSKA
jgi:aldose 1-epimerase